MGDIPGLQEFPEDRVLFLDPADISPVYLLATHSVTAVISFCDGLLVQAALQARVSILCIPSKRNWQVIEYLRTAHAAVVFPKGFWTESTVRDSMRQVVSLTRQQRDRTEKREKGREKRENQLSADIISQAIMLSQERGNAVVNSDDFAWFIAW